MSDATAIVGVVVTSLVFGINLVAAIVVFGFLVVVYKLIVHGPD